MITIAQAGVLAFRIDSTGQMRVLLITSRKRGRWTIPKGVIGLRLDARETARIEAHEEAGVSGKLSKKPLGTYEFRKWAATCRVQMYALHVTTQETEWPERRLRRRKWFRPLEALDVITRKSLRRVVKKALPLIAQAGS